MCSWCVLGGSECVRVAVWVGGGCQAFYRPRVCSSFTPPPCHTCPCPPGNLIVCIQVPVNVSASCAQGEESSRRHPCGYPTAQPLASTAASTITWARTSRQLFSICPPPPPPATSASRAVCASASRAVRAASGASRACAIFNWWVRAARRLRVLVQLPRGERAPRPALQKANTAIARRARSHLQDL